MNTKLVATFSTVACIMLATLSPAHAEKAESAENKMKVVPTQKAQTQKHDVAQTARDYKEGKIVCKKSTRSSDSADVGTVLWMWANHCDYVK